LNLQSFSFLAVLLLMATSLTLLISQNWRWTVIALAVQYIGIFWLVSQTLPVGIAVVKLVVGWMSGAVLAASQPVNEFEDFHRRELSIQIFRTITSFLVWALVFSTAAQVQALFPRIQQYSALGGMLLLGMGLLQLGMTQQPVRVIVGLLTLSGGMDILYASVESSLMVTGLLAVINLGIVLAGVYLLASPTLEEPE